MGQFWMVCQITTLRLIRDLWPEVSKSAMEEMVVDAFLLGCRDRETARNLKFANSVSLSAALIKFDFNSRTKVLNCVN